MEESRKSFVANVSHELRSPLTSIRGYVQALRDGAIPEEEREKSTWTWCSTKRRA